MTDPVLPEYGKEWRGWGQWLDGKVRSLVSTVAAIASDIAAATDSVVANTLVRRDSIGATQFKRAYIADQPTSGSHATRKDYVDNIGATMPTPDSVGRRDATGWFHASGFTSTVSPTAPNVLTRKDYVDALGTDAATPSTVVRRNVNADSTFHGVYAETTPSNVAGLTRKDYVDNAVTNAILRAQMGNSLWSAGNAEPFMRPSNSVITWVSGLLAASHFTAPVANTITKLGFPLADAGATSGLTVARFGLYTVGANDLLTLVARTDNVPTWGNNGNATAPTLPLSTVGGFPASYTFIPGQRYAIAAIFVGTTPPAGPAYMAIGSQLRPYLNGFAFGQTDLPATITLSPGWWYSPYLFGIA